MNIVARVEAGINGRLDAARRRSRAFDHVYRALDRYGAVLGGRLAAAIAYYGFFAVFALGLVAYWAFGFVLNRSEPLRDAVDDFLSQNLPFLQLQQIQESSGTIGAVGLLTLVFTGIGWVEAIRSSQRALYGVPQQPGNLVVRRVLDLAVLIVVFLLLAISVAAADAVEALLRWLVGQDGLLLTIVGWVLTVAFNVVLATALLVVIPRLRMPLRRLYPSVLVVAVGITVLNSAGREYVIRVDRNPAYTVVTGAVGLLLYLYLLNQLLLLGAALAATSGHGEVTDLAAGGPTGTDLSENEDPRRPDTS
ncbi:YhjD/YihY/BrkB family envelope integrity protein [Phytohabitans sp. ZYX-F-186]|uniref:YhjD/YihY/BrkB family envelope integrity protein n=1 Tax=Phytohabitans maris TaxID=3071409 RepID=A0ABU0ZSR2_9ACTN|nr:YhjD/YihY/BrkB family envelope integrity protein [Phytohabitans sp. ZYX-F-186]MDQ7910015.1 YhjD/YihY/BrkB family envelope integrity protein [Phytohabitans sp. ZYX-F-186]